MTETSQIREHYDRLSPLYARFWGQHIHHGYWKGNEPIKTAQIQLIEELATMAKISRGMHVLDVGCGLGGSSFWLAEHRDSRVDGVTISPVQAKEASRQAIWKGLDKKATFHVMDANKLNFPSQRFDVIWIVECSEHVFDKPAFFNRCFDLLKPGGTIALCAWLNGENISNLENQKLVDKILDAMICPSFGSLGDYTSWMLQAGFDFIEAKDVTDHVAPTWDRCFEIAQRPDVRMILTLSGKPIKNFVASFEWMKKAFQTKAMAYGMFTARRP